MRGDTYKIAAVCGPLAIALSAVALVLLLFESAGKASLEAALLFLGLSYAASMVLSIGVYRLGERHNPYLRWTETIAIVAYTVLNMYVTYAAIVNDYSSLPMYVMVFGAAAFTVGVSIYALPRRFARITGAVHAAAGAAFIAVAIPIALALFGASTVLTSIILWRT